MVSYVACLHAYFSSKSSGVPSNCVRVGFQQIEDSWQLRTEDREKGDLGAVAP